MLGPVAVIPTLDSEKRLAGYLTQERPSNHQEVYLCSRLMSTKKRAFLRGTVQRKHAVF